MHKLLMNFSIIWLKYRSISGHTCIQQLNKLDEQEHDVYQMYLSKKVYLNNTKFNHMQKIMDMEVNKAISSQLLFYW
jgi:uncharacterized protein YggL (DUF469 family)